MKTKTVEVKLVLTLLGLPHGSDGRESAVQKTQVQSLVRKMPWRRAWQPTPVFLPAEFHEQKNVTSYSPWGGKELDMTEGLTLTLLRRGVYK